MTDDNPWRTLLARRAHGMREPHTAPIISEEQRQEGWERAVENIEREMKRQAATPSGPTPSPDGRRPPEDGSSRGAPPPIPPSDPA